MFFICYTGYAMDFGSETGNTTAQRLELSSRRTTITPLNENITLEQFDGEAAVSRHLVEPAIANISIDTEATRHDPHHTHGYNPPRYQHRHLTFAYCWHCWLNEYLEPVTVGYENLFGVTRYFIRIAYKTRCYISSYSYHFSLCCTIHSPNKKTASTAVFLHK